MARLPTRFDLSGPASLRSGRMISTADTSAIGRGVESLGNSLAGLGAEIRQQQNTVDIARANAYQDTQNIALQGEFDSDPDYATFGARATDRTRKIVSTAAEMIRDPRAREMWQAEAAVPAARTAAGIEDKGRALAKQANIVAFDGANDDLRKIYTDPDSTDAERSKARADLEANIHVGLDTGLLTPEDAERRRKAYLNDADYDLGINTVAERPDAIPAGRESYYAAIRQAESGGDDKAKNPNSSAVGPYQFIAATWADLIRRHPDAGLTPNGRADPDQQEIAIRLLTEDNAEALNNSGLQASNANLYAAHFLGVGGAIHVLSADNGEMVRGLVDPAVVKANPFLADMTVGQFRRWAARKSGGGAAQEPAWFHRLTPEQQLSVRQHANAAEAQQRADMRGGLDLAAQNAPVAIANTGSYSGDLPTESQFVAAYGQQAGEQRYAALQSDVEAAQAQYAMRTLPADKINEMVTAANPTSTGDDAALEQKRYQAISTAANAVIKARQADPSAYAQQVFPKVAEAWQGAGNGPDGFKAALTATAAAETQLGIAPMDQRLLPAATAKQAVDRFKQGDLTEADRIGAVAGLITQAGTKTQQQAIYRQLVDAGLPEMTAGAVDALVRGDAAAAQRLFQAALVDPSKLAGQVSARPADIDAAIQSQIMAPGQVGDLYYGLTNGDAVNYQRAITDSSLMQNAVLLRMRQGESLNDAVSHVATDLFGDVKPVTGDHVAVLMPSDADQTTMLMGFDALLPKVREAVSSVAKVPDNAPAADGTRAVMAAAAQTRIDSVMADGYFRNAGDGYAFIDPYSGSPVVGPDGKPLIFTDEQVREAFNASVRAARKDMDGKGINLGPIHIGGPDGFFGGIGDARSLMVEK